MKELYDLQAAVVQKYFDHKERWIRESLAPHIPPSIMKCVNERRHTRFVLRYLKARKIYIMMAQFNGQELLFCDGKEIARFHWRPK